MSGVIAIVRLTAPAPDEVLTAVTAGGVNSLEITLPTPGALDTIGRWRDAAPSALIGAGTVRTVDDVRAAKDAGAQFLVTPTTSVDVMDAATRADLPVVAGALTPTEIQVAWDLGAASVKVFPVDAVGGARYVRALQAPMPDVRLVPTGGVDADAAHVYAQLGCAGVGVGSALVDDQIVARRAWDELRDRASAFSSAWQSGA